MIVAILYRPDFAVLARLPVCDATAPRPYNVFEATPRSSVTK